MVQSKITDRISVGIYKFFIDTEQVPSEISGQVNIVVLVYFMTDLRVQIIEVRLVVHIEQG